MDLVRAGFHREVEDAARGSAELGAHAAGLNAELFERFHGRLRLSELSADVDGGRGTVKHDFFGEGGATVDAAFPVVSTHAGRKFEGELLHGAASTETKRHIDDALGAKRRAYFRSVGLENWCFCRHLDGFNCGADLKLSVDTEHLGDA